MTYHCNDCGGESTDPKTCSECGSPIATSSSSPSAPAIPAAPGPASGATVVPDICPNCGAATTDKDVLFCESCGYDFTTNQPMAPDPDDDPATPPPGPATSPPAPSQPTPAPQAPVLQADPAVDEANVQLVAVVEVDPRVYTSPISDGQGGSIPCPDPDSDQDAMPHTFPLNAVHNMIGRGDPVNGLIAQIEVLSGDKGVSRKHAEVYLDDNKVWRLRDLGSSNGTFVVNDPSNPLSDLKNVPIFKDDKYYNADPNTGDLSEAPDVTEGIEVTVGMNILVGGGWTLVRFEQR